ncbi:MAG: WG repeat-containing protein [Ignavibacteriales bacterium]|nr:WG repeat-containing protein [Ignavibacteriales bacterium]
MNSKNEQIICGDFINGSCIVYRKKNGLLEKGIQLKNDSRIWFDRCTLYDFHDDLARIEKRDKSGYINRLGNHQVIYKYDLAEDFSQGYAFVSNLQDTMIIDKEGNEIFVYDEPLLTTPFDCGVAKVARFSDNANYKEEALVNCKGQFITSFEFRSKIINPFDLLNENDYVSEWLVRVKQNNKYGFLNIYGDMVIPPIYDKVSRFEYGLAAASIGERAGFINRENEFVIDPIYDEAAFAYEDKLIVKKDGYWGVIDKNGEQITEFIFRDVAYAQNGMLPVKAKYNWALLGLEQDFLTPFKFEQPPIFHEGIIQFTELGKKGVMDLRGNQLISYVFQESEFARLN